MKRTAQAPQAWVEGPGFRVLGFRVLGFGAQALGFRALGVSSSGFRV